MQDDNAVAATAASGWPQWQVAVPATAHRFHFDGRAGEYFRIWIVNLALTLVTLGLYSAWASVRTRRYFYANTRVTDEPFEYLARPVPILKGRVIAAVLFGGYVVAGQFSLVAQLALAGLIVVLAPWLIVRGAAFRARYSGWRGLTFRFIPDYGEAYLRYLLLYVLVVASFGLAYPWVKGKQKQFLVENHRFGGHWFKFTTTPASFYAPYLLAFAAVIGGVVAMTAASIGLATWASVDKQGVLFLTVGGIYAMYFVVWVFLSAALTNLVYNHAELAGHRLRSTLRGRRLLVIHLVNLVAVVASAGLLIPWAQIRLARYRAQCLELLARDDLDNLVAESSGEIGATAVEVDGFFDIDFGL